MAELVTLNTPTQVTTYRVNELHLNWDAQVIQIGLVGSDGFPKYASYGSTTATAFMNLMNTKNFSSTSMHKEILKRLQNDGLLGAGTISGSPD